MSFPLRKQERRWWCGPAAVQAALASLDFDISQKQLADYLGTTKQGTQPESVARVLKDLGFWAKAKCRWSVEEIADALDDGAFVGYLCQYSLHRHWVTVRNIAQLDDVGTVMYFLDPFSGSLEVLSRNYWRMRWSVELKGDREYFRYGVAIRKA